MHNSSISSQMHWLACANPAACHVSLLWFGLAYVFFFLVFLLDMTLFDRSPRLTARGEHDLSQIGAIKEVDGFEQATTHGYASCAV